MKNRCFRCGCPKGHSPPHSDPFVAGPLGRLSQRTAPTNPSYRLRRQNPKPVPPTGTTQNFPPLNQPLRVDLFPRSQRVALIGLLRSCSRSGAQRTTRITSPDLNLLLRKRRFLWRCNWPTRPRKGARSWAELSTIETCAVIWRPSS